MPTFTDYLVVSSLPARVGSFVKLVNNSTGLAYVSTAATDSLGAFTMVNPPAGSYTVYLGPTSGGGWTPTGNTSYLVGDGIPDSQSIAYAATITPDASLGSLILVGTLTGNITVNAPINPTPNQRITMQFTQNNPGGWVVTFAGPTVSNNWRALSGANQVSPVDLVYSAGKWTVEISPLTGKVQPIGPMKWDASAPPYNAGDVSQVSDSTTGVGQAVIDANAANGGELWLPPVPSGYVLTRYLGGSYAQKGGGILALPGVSLKGHGTKVLLRANAAFITNKGPHNYLPTIATIQANIAYGDSNILVDSSAGFVVGDLVWVGVTQNRYDTTSPGYSTFAKVSAIPDGTHITLDRPIATAMFITAPAAPTLSDGGAGALPAGQYTIGFTYETTSGGIGGCETELSATSTQTIAASHQIGVTGVALPTGVVATRWYIVSNTAGAVNGWVLRRTDASAFNINAQGNGVAAPDKSIAMSTPVDGGFPTNGGNYWRRILRLDLPFENFEISGFNLINDIANGGNAEQGVDLRYARNGRVANISGQDLGASAVECWASEGIEVENLDLRQAVAQGGLTYKGAGLSVNNCYDIRFKNVRLAAFDGWAMFIESYSRKIVAEQLHLVNNTTGTRVAPGLIFCGQESELTVDGLLVEGRGDNVTLTDDGGTGGLLTLKDVEIRTSTDMNIMRTDCISGKLMLGPQSPLAGNYVETKRWTLPFALTRNMAAFNVGLPFGIIKRAKVYMSTMTGVTSFYLGCSDKAGATFFSPNMVMGDAIQAPLAANQLIDFTPWFGRIGSALPYTNNGLTKLTSITTDGTVPLAAFGLIEIEYFVPIRNFPSTYKWIGALDDLTSGQIETAGTLLPGTKAIGDLRRSTQTTTPGGAATTYTPDATKGEAQEIIQGTTAQTLTIAAPANRAAGQFHTFKFVHFADASTWTLTFNAVYKRAGGAFANTNTSGAVDTITFYDDGTNLREVGRAINQS